MLRETLGVVRDHYDLGSPLDPIAKFPTTNTPLLATTMKEMLVSLSAYLHTDITSSLCQVTDDIEDQGHIMEHVETKI